MYVFSTGPDTSDLHCFGTMNERFSSSMGCKFEMKNLKRAVEGKEDVRNRGELNAGDGVVIVGKFMGNHKLSPFCDVVCGSVTMIVYKI